MPNYFRFIRVGEDKETPLVEVEREFLTDLGMEDQIDDKRWHPLFNQLKLLAATFGDDEEKFNQAVVRTNSTEERDPYNMFPLFRKYLFGKKFRVDAWYSPK